MYKSRRLLLLLHLYLIETFRGNKNLTGFIVNVLVPNDRMDFDQFIKIEYSTDELNYQEVPDMKVEKSYDAVLGNNYWIDVWYQGALPDCLPCRALNSISRRLLDRGRSAMR